MFLVSAPSYFRPVSLKCAKCLLYNVAWPLFMTKLFWRNKTGNFPGFDPLESKSKQINLVMLWRTEVELYFRCMQRTVWTVWTVFWPVELLLGSFDRWASRALTLIGKLGWIINRSVVFVFRSNYDGFCSVLFSCNSIVLFSRFKSSLEGTSHWQSLSRFNFSRSSGNSASSVCFFLFRILGIHQVSCWRCWYMHGAAKEQRVKQPRGPRGLSG